MKTKWYDNDAANLCNISRFIAAFILLYFILHVLTALNCSLCMERRTSYSVFVSRFYRSTPIMFSRFSFQSVISETRLGESGDVRQVSHASLDVGFEDIAEVGHGACAVPDHGVDAVAAQERVHVASDGRHEGLVRRNVQISAQKRLYYPQS